MTFSANAPAHVAAWNRGETADVPMAKSKRYQHGKDTPYSNSFQRAPLYAWVRLHGLGANSLAACKLARLAGLARSEANALAGLHDPGPREGRR